MSYYLLHGDITSEKGHFHYQIKEKIELVTIWNLLKTLNATSRVKPNLFPNVVIGLFCAAITSPISSPFSSPQGALKWSRSTLL